MRDIMLDLETLSTNPDALVISIGAVYFGPDGLGEEFHYRVEPNIAHGSIDPKTVAWWMEQSDESRSVFNETSKVPKSILPHVLDEFARFVFLGGPNRRIWGHGSSFDLPIVESSFRAIGRTPPWGHRAARDTRTILELANVRVTMPPEEKHNALSDAKAQAWAVIKAAEAIGARRLWPELPGAAA